MNKHDLFLVTIVGLVMFIGFSAAVTTPTGYYLAAEGYSQLTVSTSGHGYVSSSPSGIECGYACSESYNTGTVMRLTAKPQGNSKFQEWQGDCTGTELICTLTLDTSKSVSAVFSSETKTASLPEQAATQALEVKEQEILPEQNFIKKTQPSPKKTVTPPTTLSTNYYEKKSVSYKEQSSSTFKLTIKKKGKGIVTSSDYKIYCGDYCNGQYPSKATIKIQAFPHEGYVFSSWSGACTGKDSCNVIMDKQQIVEANFIEEKISDSSPVLTTAAVPQQKSKLEQSTAPKIQSSDNSEYPAHPTACDDYPTMPGCPGEGTNIAPPSQVTIPEVTITSFEPKKAYPNNVVNIKGKNLGYVSKIYFNGELVEGFSVLSNGAELQTIVPQGAQTGQITLVLTSGGAEYSEQDFIVWSGKCNNPDITKAFKQLNKWPQGEKDQDDCDVRKYGPYSNYKELRNAIRKVVGFSKLPGPKINHFNPSIVLPGQEVSIIGSSLDIYADDIQFDGKAIPFRLIDDGEVKIKIPEGALFGEHEIKIVSDIHGSGSAKIKIVPLPGITDFNPKKVYVNEEITISGENFYETEEISFYETTTQKETLTKNFRKESLESLQQIKVNAPQNPGSYIITVKAKNSYAKSQTFLIVGEKQSPPQITNIEPEDGRLGNNAIVYGDNLVGIQLITLNGYRIPGYTEDKTGKTLKLWLSWGIDHGVIKIKTAGGEAQAELLSNKDPVTKLITGKEETCFGGVGKGCYGSEDNKEEWSWGSQKIIAPVGCSKEVNGQRNCWVVPGSIKHDNCCARYPSGKMCGGPGNDGKPAGESNHNGKCVEEWDAAFWDVFWWRAFVGTFDATKSTDLTPKSSSRYTLKNDEGNAIISETAETLRLCAPAGHELREQYDEGFCCSGKAVNKKCTGGRGVQALAIDDGVTRTEQGADLSTVTIPLAPGEKPRHLTFDLEVTGAFSGSVKTEDGKITNCRNQNVCKATYPKNTKVTLIATPDMIDYENSGWYGDCSKTPKTESCKLTMDANKKVNLGFFKVAKPNPPAPPKMGTRPGRGKGDYTCPKGRLGCVQRVLG
ncbi:hypothetical protein HYY69_04850 [Candidatus Woesearchaeota archaeon]|nr:hypothetical protein [Candidatus Woesearchaeota archaeon]